MKITRFLYSKWLKVQETGSVFTNELLRIFRDPGVVVIFFVATLAYPILYNFIYWKAKSVLRIVLILLSPDSSLAVGAD